MGRTVSRMMIDDIKMRIILISIQIDQLIEHKHMHEKEIKEICKVLDKVSDLIFLKGKILQKNLIRP